MAGDDWRAFLARGVVAVIVWRGRIVRGVFSLAWFVGDDWRGRFGGVSFLVVGFG